MSKRNKDIDLGRINAAVSRRFALQTMFGGAAALFGMPSLGMAQNPAPNPAPRPPKKLPPAKLGDSQGSVKWISNFNKVGESPSLASYTLHALGLGITVFNNGDGSSVIGINDFYAGSVDGYNEVDLPGGTFGNPVFLPGPKVIVVAGSDGKFRTIMRNPDGSLNIQNIAVLGTNLCRSNLTTVDDDTIVYVDNTNQLQGLTIGADGVTLSVAFRQRPDTRTIDTNNVVLQVINANHFAYIVPDNAGQSACFWVTRTDTLRGFTALLATGQFCVAGPYIYCLQDDGTSYFIQQFRLDAPDGFQGWRVQFNNDTTALTNMVIANNAIYFGYGNQLGCVQLDTGALSTIQVGGGQYLLNANRIFAEDGILYICVPNGQLYAVDLASNGVNTINYSFNSLPALSQPVGIENGQFVVLTYVNNFYCMAGVDLSGLLHGYTTDSILMAEDMVASSASSAGYMPANPAYRTIVHLTDENGVARANTPIRVEATDTVTITSGDTTVTLNNPGDFQWFTTDYNGDLHLLCQADDIQSPALYLWAAFMDTQEAIVVYPDHVSVNNLKNKQANDYSSAQSFDGTNLFPGNQNHGDVANTVAGVLGVGSTIDPPAGPYSSYGSSTNMVYQATKGATGRVMSAGGQSSFTTTIDSDGTVTHTGGGSVSLNPTAAHLSWDDFKNDVVKAGKKLAKIVVQIADDIQHEITAIDGAIYQFTIDTFEKALGVITGFFKTILQDIKKAIEWISALFDWGSIIQMQSQIKGAVQSFQTQVRSYLGQETTVIQKLLGDYFSNAAKSAQQYFTQVSTEIGGSTLGSQQPHGGDPQQLYTNPPGQSSGSQGGAYAQSQAIHSKLHDNIRSATKANNVPVTTPYTMDQFVSKFNDVLNNQMPALLAEKGYLDQLKQAAVDLPKAFNTFLSNPGGALKRGIADLIAIFGDLAALFLNATGVVLDILIGLIADMLDTIISMLSGGMDIPVIGPIYKLITGKDLTFLDLASFVIAVPASIIMKIGESAQLGAENAWQVIAYGVSAMFGGIVDALSDAISDTADEAICLLDLTCALITWALSAPFSGFDHDNAAIVYFCFGLIPTFINGANSMKAAIVNLAPTQSLLTEAENFANSCYFVQGFFGIINLTFAIIAAVVDRPNFMGNNHGTLVANVFSNTGLIAKLFYPFKPYGRALTIVCDALCPSAAAFATVAANVDN